MTSPSLIINNLTPASSLKEDLQGLPQQMGLVSPQLDKMVPPSMTNTLKSRRQAAADVDVY
jgi:hypothetical protein